MGDFKALEYPTLRVPYELLNKKFRSTQKNIEREVSHVTAVTTELERKLSTGANVGEIKTILGHVVEKLNVLKRKADESLKEEKEAALLCKRRVEHLKEGADELSVKDRGEWSRTRLDRFLVEHLLQVGYYETAQKLADHAGIRPLTNIEVFLVSREIIESLRRREMVPCLTWCHDNRSKLRKLKSSLEFYLRQQEFIELIRNNQRLEAVKHARKYFSAVEESKFHEVQQIMTLLALGPETKVARYRGFYDQSRWDKIIEEFQVDSYSLYQISPKSLFSVTLQAGLSVLKTSQCHSANLRNRDCPVCSEHFNELAKGMPVAHCAQSRLICTISGEAMNEHNSPMVLPNGNVYGKNALEKMALANEGIVTCPRTAQMFPLKDCEKVFVM